MFDDFNNYPNHPDEPHAPMPNPHDHCHDPHRRWNPPFTGDVDTTQIGGIYDVQHMHGHCDPHCGYHIPAVAPLPPAFPSMTEAEQIRDLSHKVNELCGTVEGYNKKVEDAFCTVVNSTLCNDAYYKEVWTENGYSPESGSNYKVIHIPFLDRARQPIYFELGLAYENTTNSGLKEECFNASQRYIADKLIPAQNTGDSFTGCVVWKNAPIYTQESDSYTFAVTQNGFFRSYKNATPETLKLDKVRNSCGARGILVYNKELATSDFPEDADKLKARIAVGQNYETKERFVIVVDGGESVGCTSEQLANIFIKYGCMVALELVSGEYVYGMDKGAMMFAPAVASEDDTPSVPVSNAFWYVSKRRHYHNEYVKDVALLTQKMGEEIWRRIILNEQTDYVKNRVVELAKEIADETQARIDGDNTLDAKIDTEVARLDAKCDKIESESKERDNALNELILTKETESKARDTKLQENIDAEADTREKNDVKEVNHVDDGDKRTYSLYRNDGTKIAENIIVYEYDKLVAQLQTLGEVAENLKTEVQERKKADDYLQSQITEEVANRTNSVTELQNQITAEQTARIAKDTDLEAKIKAEETARIAGDASIKQEIEADIQGLIDAEKVARENGDKELAESIRVLKNDYEDFKTTTTADLTQLNTQVDSLVVDVTNIRTVVDTHTTQMASINATITALQTTISTMETSLENMKQTISALQTSWEEYKTELDKALADIRAIIENLDSTYLRIDGGTMTGALNVLAPTEDSNAVNKKYVDDAIKDIDLTGYVKTSDEMSETELAELEAIFA